MFTDANGLKLEPMALITVTGIKQIVEKFNLIVSSIEAERILKDVRAYNFGKFECTYKNLVDFMIKKKINIIFADKGATDPLLANTVQAINRSKDLYELTFEQLFKLFDAERLGHFNKEEFMVCTQGMNLGAAVEDIMELFNFLDEADLNRVSQTQFVNSFTNITSKISGPNMLEKSLSKGVIQKVQAKT